MDISFFDRSVTNPILVAQPNLPWASKKVYNCAVIREPGRGYEMIFRAMGDEWISRLGRATSQHGINFNIQPTPVFSPTGNQDSHGVEDPRITRIGENYWMAYTAYDGLSARLAVAVSPNLTNWESLGPIIPDFETPNTEGAKIWSKAGAIFPQRVNGKYMMLFGDYHIWPAFSDDLQTWHALEKPVLTQREEQFDGGFVEMGPPPIKTPMGWLVLYHGVQRMDDVEEPRVYSLAAAMLDLHDPTQVLWRSTKPLLQPEGRERIGYIDVIPGGFERLKGMTLEELKREQELGRIPLAIFCCGALLHRSNLSIYYSAMDTSINLATTTLDRILKS